MDSSMSISSMSGSMTMSSSPTSTMSGMSMSSSTDASMSMSSGTLMGMEKMAMVFFTSTSTPLYSWSWSPRTTAQYAGTCIFLVAFAAIFRGLLAIRVHAYDLIQAIKRRRSGGIKYADMLDIKTSARPWRTSEAVTIATMDVVIAGVSYLLMLAVMTMNVGYFLSILSGVFIGSIAFAHLTANVLSH